MDSIRFDRIAGAAGGMSLTRKFVLFLFAFAVHAMSS
jgi:hypothetical protein